jgi:antitoxin (DNA-binding transcriptional repressor) of toxin-antitoxin stability system
MKTIGIRELKAHLSRVLRDVGAGESFLVTDRGRVIAELRRPGMVDSSASDEDRALARLAAAGVLRVAERPSPTYRPSPISSRKGTAKSLLDADRGE